MTTDLFTSIRIGDLTLPNRAIMAPMTRSRAIDFTPNALMAEYYAQRADAGLLITEGVAPSRNGLGYARTPGLYSEEQIAGWRLVTDAVHERGGRIFAQLMHVGRMAHPDNMPEGGEIVAPGAVRPEGQMYTDTKGSQDYVTPREMTTEDVLQARDEFVQAAKNAIEAGFDGIELHGANGYLLHQFLNPTVNQRDDEYGGSSEARNRFVLEVARATAEAIGAGRVGVRLSPGNTFGDLQPFEGMVEQYTNLSQELGKLNLAYLHLVDASASTKVPFPWSTKLAMREAFGGPTILNGGYDLERANADLAEGRADVISFGVPYLANADLLERFRTGSPLNAPDFDRLYTPGPEGYTDYPTLSSENS